MRHFYQRLFCANSVPQLISASRIVSWSNYWNPSASSVPIIIWFSRRSCIFWSGKCICILSVYLFICLMHSPRRKDPMYALMVFSERMSEDNPWSASSSTRQCCDMPPPNQIGSTQSLADEKTHVARTRKSLDLSTSTPVTSRKTDLSPTHSVATAMSGTKFTRRAAPPAASSISEPSVPRGDLSLVCCGND